MHPGRADSPGALRRGVPRQLLQLQGAAGQGQEEAAAAIMWDR